MTNDIMSKITNFVCNVKNVAFTDADAVPWFLAHTYSQDVLEVKEDNSRKMFSNVKDEILPFIKYINTRGVVVKLLDEGGTNYTPVMNILGLLEYTMKVPKNHVAQNVRDLAANSLVDMIIGDKKYIEMTHANAALSLPIQELLRKAREQRRASGGASIATEPQQVLAARACVLLYDLL
jgi:hypothetical protein